MAKFYVDENEDPRVLAKRINYYARREKTESLQSGYVGVAEKTRALSSIGGCWKNFSSYMDEHFVGINHSKWTPNRAWKLLLEVACAARCCILARIKVK
jgi:hypothetical protein